MAKGDNDSAGWGGAIVLCVVLYFVWVWVSDSKLRYTLQYGTDSVTVDDKPEDCDYNFAPIGNKGCHYEKSVVVTKWGNNVKTNRKVVSYDDGKTWDWDDADTHPSGTSVQVYWKKVPR